MIIQYWGAVPKQIVNTLEHLVCITGIPRYWAVGLSGRALEGVTFLLVPKTLEGLNSPSQ